MHGRNLEPLIRNRRICGQKKQAYVVLEAEVRLK